MSVCLKPYCRIAGYTLVESTTGSEGGLRTPPQKNRYALILPDLLDARH
jgi:hypothetical protein